MGKNCKRISNRTNPESLMTDGDLVKWIYQKMGGDVSNIEDGCNIPGVVCNEDGKVIQLYWPRKSLTGSIPEDIGEWTELEVL